MTSTSPAGPEPGPLRLDDQLCFALYRATNAVTRNYRPLLGAIGLTYAQYLVMMALWERDDVALGDLATRLDLPLHGLSPVLGRLREQGLLDKQRDPDDRRTLRIRLTPRGRELEVRAARAQQQVVCRSGLSEDGLAGLRGSLRSLADQLGRLGA